MRGKTAVLRSARGGIAWGGAVGLLTAAIIMIFRIAPAEQSMGETHRILYVHVAVAWCGLAGLVLCGCAGAVYLWRRALAWDQGAQAAAELGWLCTTLTLVTGSLWAHEAWNTWWTWDPRLTTSLVLWLLYAGYFLVRGSVDERHRKARLSAVVALLALLDVPLVIMAARWFRGMHPAAPAMPAVMRIVLLGSALGFSVFFGWLMARRRGQLWLADRLAKYDGPAAGRRGPAATNSVGRAVLPVQNDGGQECPS